MEIFSTLVRFQCAQITTVYQYIKYRYIQYIYNGISQELRIDSQEGNKQQYTVRQLLARHGFFLKHLALTPIF